MTEQIRTSNIPLGTTLGEFLGHEIIGNAGSIKRFSRASVLGALEAVASGVQAGGGVVFTTKAEADANRAYDAFQLALIASDPTVANNGIYQKIGASGTGSWSRVADLPNEMIQFTVTGGTGNAITATMSPQVPTTQAGKLYIVTPTSANTGAITLNGVSVLNSLGSTPAANTFLNGVPVSMIWQADHYQILTSWPVDTAGVVADATAARDDAEAAQVAAEAAAAALGNQVHQYDTRAQAIAATIPAGVGLVRLLGRGAAGDLGGGLYKKLGGAPGATRSWHFQNTAAGHMVAAGRKHRQSADVRIGRQ
jgi:hypothetical protein